MSACTQSDSIPVKQREGACILASSIVAYFKPDIIALALVKIRHANRHAERASQRRDLHIVRFLSARLYLLARKLFWRDWLKGRGREEEAGESLLVRADVGSCYEAQGDDDVVALLGVLE